MLLKKCNLFMFVELLMLLCYWLISRVLNLDLMQTTAGLWSRRSQLLLSKTPNIGSLNIILFLRDALPLPL